MKKALVISISLNISIILFFIGKRIYWTYGAPAAAGVSNYETMIQGKYSALSCLQIDNDDIVFVGNSLVEGFHLNDYFPGKKIKNRGVGGSETIHLINKIPDIVRNKPSKLFIEIGINDIVRGTSNEAILENFKKILSIVRNESPLTRIYAHSLLPVTDDYAIYNDVICKYNSLLEKYCMDNGINYIDLYKLYESGGQMNKILTYDGIHLNGKGYEIWRKEIEPYLK